jgi:hypothetical protein
MTELKAVTLEPVSAELRDAVKPVGILWQAPDTIAFVARGRAHRSEFHADAGALGRERLAPLRRVN